MAFRASLKFEGKEFDVLDCTYSFRRDIDLKGRPSSNVYGGNIVISIESTEDSTILSQMVNQFKPNSGTITFNRGDEESKMKELSWTNGYVIDYREAIDVRGMNPMEIVFTISAETVKLESVEISQRWPK